MKKTLWMLGVAVAALTSCTQSEVLDVPESRVIQFDTFVGKSTRAVNNLMTTDNLSNFFVYGAVGTKDNADSFTNDDGTTLLFDGVEVSRTKTGEVWGAFSYTDLKTWEMNKIYRFAGYSDGNTQITDNGAVSYFANESVTLNNHPGFEDGEDATDERQNVWGLKFEGYEAKGNDLLAAVPAERSTITNQGAQTAVHFTFEHLLSQVIFRFTYGSTQESDIKVRIKEFNLNAIKKSNCTVIYYGDEVQNTYVKWESQFNTPSEVNTLSSTPQSAVGEYTFFEDNKTIEVGTINNIALDINYVIPQKNDMTVSFTVESYRVNSDGEETITNTANYNDISLKIANHEYWRPGYVYRYEADLNPTEHIIYFTASVDAWVDDPNRDVTISGTTGASE